MVRHAQHTHTHTHTHTQTHTHRHTHTHTHTHKHTHMHTHTHTHTQRTNQRITNYGNYMDDSSVFYNIKQINAMITYVYTISYVNHLITAIEINGQNTHTHTHTHT